MENSSLTWYARSSRQGDGRRDHLFMEVSTMSANTRQSASPGDRRGFVRNTVAVSGAAAILLALIILPWVTAHAEQTRDQCRKCCEGKGFDDYYLEQCKLKCFRSPDHCADAKAAPAPSTEREAVRPAPAERPPAVEPRPPSTEPRPAVRQPAPPPSTEPPAPRREAAPRGAPFSWPGQLSLTPGKEWEAAGQILSANGIPPQHPNAQRALQAIEAVLVDFARRNPQGGQLPTAALEQIIRQNR